MHAPETREGREPRAVGEYAVGKKWTNMMSELGKDVKIPALWRMSALLEICPKAARETDDDDEVGRDL